MKSGRGLPAVSGASWVGMWCLLGVGSNLTIKIPKIQMPITLSKAIKKYETIFLEKNGPFYCLDKKIKASTFLNFPNVVSTTKKGERGKVSLEEFSKYFKNEDTFKLTGESGVGVFLDSFSTYHRGGFCKSKDRVTLRLCYQSHDALYDDQVGIDNTYVFNNNIKINNAENIFKKYFFFKKKSNFMKFISNKIVNMYRKLDFEI